jgi:hypothetical protein
MISNQNPYIYCYQISYCAYRQNLARKLLFKKYDSILGLYRDIGFHFGFCFAVWVAVLGLYKEIWPMCWVLCFGYVMGGIMPVILVPSPC